MAFSVGGAGAQMVATVVFAGYNHTASKRYHFEWDTDLTTTLGHVTTFADALAGVTDADLTITVGVPVVDAAQGAGAGADVYRRAVLSVSLDELEPGQQVKGTLEIPSPLAAIFTGGNPYRVDTANAALNTFVNCFKAAGGQGMTIADGQTIAALVGGRKSFKPTPSDV